MEEIGVSGTYKSGWKIVWRANGQRSEAIQIYRDLMAFRVALIQVQVCSTVVYPSKTDLFSRKG